MIELPDFYGWAGDDIAATIRGAHVLFTTRTDAPEDRDANRERIAAYEVVPDQLLWGTQVHGSTILVDAAPGAEADGQATARPQVAPLVFTADCLPLALISDEAVAMIHCGWRGVAAGIVPAAIEVMRELSDEDRFSAALGPSARGCCYEVGEEVHEHFKYYENARQGERNLDLAKVVRAQLHDASVTNYDTGVCTMCNPEHFFSHRHGDTGRQLSLVWRV